MKKQFESDAWQNQSFLCRKGGRIYIYIVEEQYFSGGFSSGIKGEGVRVNFEIIAWVSTDRSLNQGYYREKLPATSRKFPDHSFFFFFSGSSSSRIMRFALLELTGCSRVTQRAIFLLGLNISTRFAVRLSRYVSPVECEQAGLTRSYAFWSVWHFLSRLATRSRNPPRGICSSFMPMALQTPEMSRNKSKPTGEVFCYGAGLKRART